MQFLEKNETDIIINFCNSSSRRMIVTMAVYILILGVSDFLSAVAWNREKDVEMISAKDWPIHGPWIVFVGR